MTRKAAASTSSATPISERDGSDSVIPRFSLDGEPDPWLEPDKAGVGPRQFQPLATAGMPA